MELNRDKILSKFYRGEELTKAEINWLAEQEFDQFSQGIEPVPFEEKLYKALAKGVKMKTRGHYVISDVPGKFFLTEFSLDGRMYLDRDNKWIVSKGVVVYRWPGMYETFDIEATEAALIRHKTEIKDMGKNELLRKIEKAFPLKKWIKGNMVK